MLMFLREELTTHESAQDGSHGARRFACLGDPHSQRVPCTPSGVCGSGQTMHTRRFRGYCMDAPFWAGETLVMVHLDRREGGGESEGYARCRRCRVASIL